MVALPRRPIPHEAHLSHPQLKKLFKPNSSIVTVPFSISLGKRMGRGSRKFHNVSFVKERQIHAKRIVFVNTLIIKREKDASYL